MDETVNWFVGSHPKLAAILIGMGTFRTFFKPIFSAIEKAVEESPSKNDDRILENVRVSKVFRAFVWVLDFLFSIKVPVVKK